MFDALARLPGVQAEWVTLPPSYDDAIAEHRVVVESDLAHNLRAEYATGKASLSAQLLGMLESGQGHSATVSRKRHRASAMPQPQGGGRSSCPIPPLRTPRAPRPAPWRRTTRSTPAA